MDATGDAARYMMRDVPMVLGALPSAAVRQNGVAMIIEAHLLGDYSTKDLALAVNALRDRLVGGSGPLPQARATVPSAVRRRIEWLIAERGYAGKSFAFAGWTSPRVELLAAAGFESCDLVAEHPRRGKVVRRTVRGAIVRVGAMGGAGWKRVSATRGGEP